MMPTIYPYRYKFIAEFYCGRKAHTLLNSAVSNALFRFHMVARKNAKWLNVKINSLGFFEYELLSTIPISQENLLRCTQCFSKELSKEWVVAPFIRPSRLLKRK